MCVRTGLNCAYGLGNMNAHACMNVYAYVCACVCVCVCARVFMSVCSWACVPI